MEEHRLRDLDSGVGSIHVGLQSEVSAAITLNREESWMGVVFDLRELLLQEEEYFMCIRSMHA